MTEKNDHTFIKKQINNYHEVYASLIWFRRGQIIDDDYNRINKDWLDARRIVGYKLADDILDGCKKGTCYSVPQYYLPYLSSLSINEFKEIKSYLMWEKLSKTIPVKQLNAKSIYLDACKEVEQHKINCKCSYDEEIPKNIRSYLLEVRQKAYNETIRRKAYWNSLNENNNDDIHNWHSAEKIVSSIYKPLEKTNRLNKKQVLNIVSLIDKNHHLTNMFEYVIRCHLFKNQGLTRKPSKDERELLTCCAKTHDLIGDIV